MPSPVHERARVSRIPCRRPRHLRCRTHASPGRTRDGGGDLRQVRPRPSSSISRAISSRSSRPSPVASHASIARRTPAEADGLQNIRSATTARASHADDRVSVVPGMGGGVVVVSHMITSVVPPPLQRGGQERSLAPRRMDRRGCSVKVMGSVNVRRLTRAKSRRAADTLEGGAGKKCGLLSLAATEIARAGERGPGPTAPLSAPAPRK